MIQTEASALQNIADTANRLVARMDQVLSDENVAAHLRHAGRTSKRMTGAIGGQREDLRALIVNARKSSEQLEKTLATTNRAIERRRSRTGAASCPALIAKLDSTLDAARFGGQRANGILSDNRAAISSFTNDGLGQLGPTLAELRALVRDLRRISDRLDSNPTPLPARPRRAQGVRTANEHDASSNPESAIATLRALRRPCSAALVLAGLRLHVAADQRQAATRPRSMRPTARVQADPGLADGALAAGDAPRPPRARDDRQPAHRGAAHAQRNAGLQGRAAGPSRPAT